MWSDIQVVVPPAVEPVTVEELRSHARIAVNDYDDILNQAIVAARERCEGFCRRSLIDQTLDIWYDSFEMGVIENIPRGPVRSLLGIYTYDYGSIETVVSDEIYRIHGNTIIFSDWVPLIRPRLGLKLQIVSGFGDDPEDVPMSIRMGILEYATHLFEHPAGEGAEIRYVVQANSGALPESVRDKWRRYQITIV